MTTATIVLVDGYVAVSGEVQFVVGQVVVADVEFSQTNYINYVSRDPGHKESRLRPLVCY